jgi:hypothetical protein
MVDPVVDGFLGLALEVGKLLIECALDVVAIVAESIGSDSSHDTERLARLRRWNERVQRSLKAPSTTPSQA